eukprot:gene111-20362_t
MGSGTRIRAATAVGFSLADVELMDGSRLAAQRDDNTEWLMGLEVDRLTCLYTAAANLTCSTTGWPYKCIASPQRPACDPYPHQAYFGHYLGHYLSAIAMAYENTGNTTLKKRGDAVVSILANVQSAQGENGQQGLIYPYDITSFSNLYDKAPTTSGGDDGGNCQPVCVPFYVLHKVLAGLLDQHTRAHNPQALGMATALADWVAQSVEGAVARGGIAKWQGVLNTEWGGMNDVLYQVYQITGNPKHLAAGKRFNHWQWTAPLAAGLDALDGSNGNAGGNHANTHIPEVVGTARGFEVTGNSTQKNIVTNFFNILTAGEGEQWNPAAPGGHSYATGGSNAAEHWFGASTLGDTLLPNTPGYYKHLGSHTEESCTQYNALKVARHMFQWSADAKLADFYERAFLNGILGNENLGANQPPGTIDLEYG